MAEALPNMQTRVMETGNEEITALESFEFWDTILNAESRQVSR